MFIGANPMKRMYSEEYKRIRAAMEKWPQWKIDYYNKYYAVPGHEIKNIFNMTDEELAADFEKKMADRR
jgi:hypothetical protein